MNTAISNELNDLGCKYNAFSFPEFCRIKDIFLEKLNFRKKEYRKSNVLLERLVVPTGMIDHYYAPLVYTPEFVTLRLKINNKVWMSLTPMEIQSMIIPIRKARGICFAGGLGLGYYPLSIAQKPEVEKVIVCENNQAVIQMFENCFSEYPNVAKLQIIESDVRSYLSKIKINIDFCFMDIYQTLLPDIALEDLEAYSKNNAINYYYFWGQDLVISACLHNNIQIPGNKDINLEKLLYKDFIAQYQLNQVYLNNNLLNQKITGKYAKRFLKTFRRKK